MAFVPCSHGPDPRRVARSVGRRVAELRAAKGWTQEQLAELLSVSVERIQRVERGANLTIASLCQLAGALGCDVAALFEAPLSMVSPVGRPRGS
jgi:transcriptional regulator with XRE-family HTH domain